MFYGLLLLAMETKKQALLIIIQDLIQLFFLGKF